MKVRVYVDGFNLYYGALKARPAARLANRSHQRRTAGPVLVNGQHDRQVHISGASMGTMHRQRWTCWGQVPGCKSTYQVQVAPQ